MDKILIPISKLDATRGIRIIGLNFIPSFSILPELLHALFIRPDFVENSPSMGTHGNCVLT